MALRVDLFSVDETIDLETLEPDELVARLAAPDDRVTWVAFVSASDHDEDALAELLERAAGTGCLTGAGVQGVGPASEAVDDAGVDRLARLPADGEPVSAWRDTIAGALSETVGAGRRLGWWTRYDRAGSLTDGADEWPTAWSPAVR